MTTIHLGNEAPVEIIKDPETGEVVERRRRTDLKGTQITTVSVPEGTPLTEAFVAVTHNDGVWNSHSDKPPVWVCSDDPALATLVASNFGGIEVIDYFDLDELAAWGVAVAEAADTERDADSETPARKRKGA